MMSDNNHIIYTAEDIHRYFSGSMSADEMYAMDKAALNDPLLAEAMEGYHALPSFAKEEGYAEIQKHLDELKDRLPGKVVSIKKYNNNWWKVAAAVLLIGGSVLAFIKLNSSNHKEENTIAAKDKDLVTPSLKTDSNTFINADSTKAIASLNSVQQQSSFTITKENTRKATLSVSSNATVTPASGTFSYLWKDKDNKDIASDDKSKGLVNSSLDSSAIMNNGTYFERDSYATINEDEKAKTKKELGKKAFQQPLTPNFTGRITDVNNNAIPYAKLTINNRRQTKTDANGFFNMALPDTSIRLDIGMSGYYPQTTNVTANNFAGIVLKAKRSTFRKSTSPADSIGNRSQVQILYKLGAEPKEGWIKFQDFLAQQCSNSEYDNGKPVVGETIVQFEIDSYGMPTNFHFEKSIDQDVNDGVENLIINGPEWKYTEHSAIPGIVRIKIIF